MIAERLLDASVAAMLAALTWASVADAPAGQVSSRLPNSMNACVESSGVSRVPWQRGQSGQPSPEPVRRTAAPVKTITVHTTSAETATQKYARGVRLHARIRRMPRHCGEESSQRRRSRPRRAR